MGQNVFKLLFSVKLPQLIVTIGCLSDQPLLNFYPKRQTFYEIYFCHELDIIVIEGG